MKAVIAAYPVTYIDSDWYSKPSLTKAPFGTPQLPRAVLDEHLRGIKEGVVVSEATPMDRVPLGIVALQHGLFSELFGEENEGQEFCLDKITKAKKDGDQVPFLFVLHGKGDTAVPCEQSVQFVKEWQDKFGKKKAIGEFQEGEHGFDAEAKLEDEWMQRGLEGVTKAWLG